MALGRRRTEQQELWVATTELPRSAGHPFYGALNEVLREADFDRWLERLCEPYYSAGKGRPSIPPGVYFRMIFIGYFEGIGSQRGIAWRCSDSLSLRDFLGLAVQEATPDHSSLTRVHQRLPKEVHEQVFVFVLKIAEAKQLLKGKRVAVDSTTLEANAAMKSIVRKDTGEDWKEYLRGLAREAGFEDPTDEELRRFDKQRKDKTASNEDWVSKTDPDARITKMKDKTTHLAYKAEHVVDLDSNLVLAAPVYEATRSDHDTLAESVVQAQINVVHAESAADIEEVAADKGYHKAETIETVAENLGIRTYIPEPERQYENVWTDKPPRRKKAVYGNRRRVRGNHGKQLQKLRSEYTERTFAHVCETGGSRRCWLRGLVKVSKRYLLQVAAHNLGVILRALFGVGTARSLQEAGSLVQILYLVTTALLNAIGALQIDMHRPRSNFPDTRPRLAIQ